jgi:hypothetical protein
MAGYLAELADRRTTLDDRYGQIKSGRFKPVTAEGAFKQRRSKKNRRRSWTNLKTTTGKLE